MNRKAQWIIVLLFLSCAFLVLTSAFLFISLRASNKTLDKIKLILPGENISSVINKLGPPRGSCDASNNIWNIKDPAYCNGKKLYLFYLSTPPCREIEVYTDKDDNVVFVTWHTL